MTDFRAALNLPTASADDITVRYSTGGGMEDVAYSFADMADALRFAQYEFEYSNGFGWADVYVGDTVEVKFA